MGKRQEPVRKSVKDVLADLLAGHREAAFGGPESALKYLHRTFEGQASLPNAVKAVAYDLTAEAQAQCGLWEDCRRLSTLSCRLPGGLLRTLDRLWYRAARPTNTRFRHGYGHDRP